MKCLQKMLVCETKGLSYEVIDEIEEAMLTPVEKLWMEELPSPKPIGLNSIIIIKVGMFSS